jgi:hypothetical protein
VLAHFSSASATETLHPWDWAVAEPRVDLADPTSAPFATPVDICHIRDALQQLTGTLEG